MPTITIRHRSAADSQANAQTNSFAATVIIDNRTEYEITVRNPFDEKQERDLEFYFEEWIQFPFDEQVRAQRAAASVAAYGEALFEDVFGGRKAYSDYQQACEGGLSTLRIEIEGDSPAFQALHWEAMKDPDLPRPLAVDCVFTRRKRLQGGGLRVRLKPSSEINLLVVTARPDEEKDVGYRTISRPLIEAIERGQLRVNAELLRPGTFEALSEHLERKEGFYHIVHFDAHGALMNYEQFQKQVDDNRYTFHARWGRADLEPYEGLKAFLLLEGAAKGQAEPVEAQELANLLIAKGIQVCILNACQSGKQISGGLIDGEMRETSLGSRLMTAGMKTVVAMGYSVTVGAASLMMEKLYGELFTQNDVSEAIRRGRKALLNNKNRRVYFNQIVELEDWLLPVVYANGEVDFQLEPLSGKERSEALVARGQRYRFAKPTYGFVGRDLEILKIEKALLRHNVLLLQGMGGTGKTTLLNYLREWWQTTGFAREVFYFGYDEAAHTLQQMLRVMGKRLYADEYAFAEFEAMPIEAQIVDVAERLRAEPYGLVLDNLESVTGQALAIMNTLPEEEREKVKGFLMRLEGGRTKVVLGSRSPEDWLKETFTTEGRENRYVLGGLDPESRTVLAQKILTAQMKDAKRIAAIRQDEDFGRLMTLLAGYPLAMEVVLGNLARQSPTEVLAGLDAADVESFDVGGKEKTNNILKCVEYSHSNLSKDAQKLLVCLAPFTGFVYRPALESYGEHLKKLKPFKDYAFDLFDEAVQEAIQWGLLFPIYDEENRLLTIQPVFPYFLRTKLSEMDLEAQNAIYEGFKTHYRGLSENYKQMMNSQDPKEKGLGLFFCRFEYENLFKALQMCIEKQESIRIYRCLDNFLDLTNNVPAKLKLSQAVCDASQHYSDEVLSGTVGLEIGEAFLKLGVACVQTQNYEAARENHQRSIELFQKNTVFSEKEKQLAIATNYHQLGILAQELREYEQAQSYYQKALDIRIEHNDRYSQASTYGQLGIVTQELREYEQAQEHYQQALNIFIKYNDRYSQANTYHQLGSVAQELRKYEQAQSHYQQTLDIYNYYNDRYSQASTHHNLGRVAEELRKYEQARGHYQQALDIYIEYNDQYSQASAYHQLGRVAEELKEYEQARSHYQRALDIKVKYNDHYSQASTYHQLGIVAEELKEYEQARSHYQQALDIFTVCNDRHSQSKTYHQLGRVAEELKEYEQARSHYQRALDIKVKYNDHYSQASTYHQLGIVAEELKEYEQARSHYQRALDIKVKYNDRYSQASTYHQLGKVAEKLKEYEQARDYYRQALETFVEFSDNHDALIVLSSFNRLYQTTENNDLLNDVAECMNSTGEEISQLFDNLNST